MKKILTVFLVIMMAAAALTFSGCITATGAGQTAGQTTGIHFSTKALDGTAIDQSILAQHKVNFLHYWATWCGPCVGELPQLLGLYAKFGSQAGFIGIVSDATDSKGIAAAQKILADSKVTFMNVAPFPQVSWLFGEITAIPCTMLVDSYGNQLCGQIVGAVGDEAYAQAIDKALANAK
jgi:thiol-disulfide isomerase/thioredoxin